MLFYVLLEALVTGAGEGALITAENYSLQVFGQFGTAHFDGDNSLFSVQHDVVNHVAFVFGVIEAERTAEIFGALLGNRRMPSFHVHSKSRFKACVKGAVFALEELLPTMLVPVMASDALDVARGEFTEFAVQNSLGFLLGTPGGPGERHGADAAVVPRQRGGLIVVQLLLNIWRFGIGGVIRVFYFFGRGSFLGGVVRVGGEQTDNSWPGEGQGFSVDLEGVFLQLADCHGGK